MATIPKAGEDFIGLDLDIDAAYRAMREQPGMTLVLPYRTVENGRSVVKNRIVRTNVDIIEG